MEIARIKETSRSWATPYLKQIIFARLCKRILIVFLFFLSACADHRDQFFNFSASLTVKERTDLEQFFQSFLFKNYGAYVLFGSKPLCELSVRDMDSQATDIALKKFWAQLPLREREKIEELRRKVQSKKTQEQLDKEASWESACYRGWLTFQNLKQDFKLKGFLFRVLPTCQPDSYDLLFINIQQTSLVLAENYEIFKQAAGMDFHPLHVVFEAEDPNSIFWKNVMSVENHLAKGLLFGFGCRNSLFGSWAFSVRKGDLGLPSEEYRKEVEEFVQQTPSLLSTDVVPQGAFAFNIPLFSTIPGDETAKKYEKERIIIEQKYHNQDIIEVTLKQLFHQPMHPSKN